MPATTIPQPNAQSAWDAVQAFAKGELLWTVDMGGLGPAYEQATPVCAIDMTRPLPHTAHPARCRRRSPPTRPLATRLRPTSTRAETGGSGGV